MTKKYEAKVSPSRMHVVVEKMFVGPSSVSTEVCRVSNILLIVALIFLVIPYMDSIRSIDFLLTLSKSLEKSVNTNAAFLDEAEISSVILLSARISGKVDLPILKPFGFRRMIGLMCSDIRLRRREL